MFKEASNQSTTGRSAQERKFQARLDQWSAKVRQLKAQAQEAEADAEIKTDEILSNTEDRLETFRGKVDDLKSASKDAWEDVADGCETSWRDFKQSLDKAIDRFDSSK